MSGEGVPCTVSAKLSKFEYVREKGAGSAGSLHGRGARVLYSRGAGVPYGWKPPVKRQTERRTQLKTLLSLNFIGRR